MEGYESRIRRYIREQAETRVDDNLVADLESSLEDTERQLLRASKELLDETLLRMRAEHFREELEGQKEELLEQIRDLEQKLDQDIGTPQRIPRKPKPKADPVPEVDVPITSLTGRVSARKRGGVK